MEHTPVETQYLASQNFGTPEAAMKRSNVGVSHIYIKPFKKQIPDP